MNAIDHTESDHTLEWNAEDVIGVVLTQKFKNDFAFHNQYRC